MQKVLKLFNPNLHFVMCSHALYIDPNFRSQDREVLLVVGLLVVHTAQYWYLLISHYCKNLNKVISFFSRLATGLVSIERPIFRFFWRTLFQAKLVSGAEFSYSLFLFAGARDPFKGLKVSL